MNFRHVPDVIAAKAWEVEQVVSRRSGKQFFVRFEDCRDSVPMSAFELRLLLGESRKIISQPCCLFRLPAFPSCSHLARK